jgi:hypothetical protein
LISFCAFVAILFIDKVLQHAGFKDVTNLYSLPITCHLDLNLSVGWYLSDLDKVWCAICNCVQVLDIVSVHHVVGWLECLWKHDSIIILVEGSFFNGSLTQA